MNEEANSIIVDITKLKRISTIAKEWKVGGVSTEYMRTYIKSNPHLFDVYNIDGITFLSRKEIPTPSK